MPITERRAYMGDAIKLEQSYAQRIKAHNARLLDKGVVGQSLPEKAPFLERMGMECSNGRWNILLQNRGCGVIRALFSTFVTDAQQFNKSNLISRTLSFFYISLQLKALSDSSFDSYPLFSEV